MTFLFFEIIRLGNGVNKHITSPKLRMSVLSTWFINLVADNSAN
jgi:hypothetical protein